jgi:hypothetical protein
MILGDHRHEKRRRKKNKHSRLDWDINTSRCTTKRTGRLDWDINTTKTLLTTTTRETKQQQQQQLHPQAALMQVM